MAGAHKAATGSFARFGLPTVSTTEMRTPRRKCHYRAVTLADDPRARLALRDIPAISLAALECDLLWCGLREFGEFSYVRPTPSTLALPSWQTNNCRLAPRTRTPSARRGRRLHSARTNGARKSWDLWNFQVKAKSNLSRFTLAMLNEKSVRNC